MVGSIGLSEKKCILISYNYKLSISCTMNFLAHIYLSFKQEDIMIGNFLADFVRNTTVKGFSKEVKKGVGLHRKIDTFTDSHTIVKQSTARMQQYHGKYAPVVVDVCYDYILASNWEKYSDQNLNDFCMETYVILEARMDTLPEKVQKFLPELIKRDWLAKYGTEEGLRFTFSKLDNRTKFPSEFYKATDHLFKHYEEFEKEFNLFFPDLIHMSKDFIEE